MNDEELSQNDIIKTQDTLNELSKYFNKFIKKHNTFFDKYSFWNIFKKYKTKKILKQEINYLIDNTKG